MYLTRCLSNIGGVFSTPHPGQTFSLPRPMVRRDKLFQAAKSPFLCQMTTFLCHESIKSAFCGKMASFLSNNDMKLLTVGTFSGTLPRSSNGVDPSPI